MNDSEGTARTAHVYIPSELVLAILNSVDNSQRVATICNARLVSRSWSDLLLRSLYRDVWITLTEDHNLDALCTFFATHPDIYRKLTLEDVYKNVKWYEDEDEDAEEADVGEEGDSEISDEGHYDEEACYQCSVDPDLLKRTLSHLPRLHDLRLHNIFPSHAATLDHDSAGTKGIRVQNLRMIIPVWAEDCSPAARLILHTLSMFDWVDSVTLKSGYFDGIYTGITEPISAGPTSLPLRVQSLNCADTHRSILEELAEEPVFSAISTLEACIDSSYSGLHSLLAITKCCLQSLKCTMTEPILTHGPQPAIDLSVCNALNSLTLRFPLCAHHRDAHPEMVKHVNKILDSLTRRTHTASSLKRFVLQITLRQDEPGDAWPLAREEMRVMEDILLSLVDRQVCSTVHVETDLQEWYSFDVWRVRRLGKGKEELDSRWSRYVAVCEEALHRAWSRLDERGALTISSVPVTLTEEDPDFLRSD